MDHVNWENRSVCHIRCCNTSQQLRHYNYFTWIWLVLCRWRALLERSTYMCVLMTTPDLLQLILSRRNLIPLMSLRSYVFAFKLRRITLLGRWFGLGAIVEKSSKTSNLLNSVTSIELHMSSLLQRHHSRMELLKERIELCKKWLG